MKRLVFSFDVVDGEFLIHPYWADEEGLCTQLDRTEQGEMLKVLMVEYEIRHSIEGRLKGTREGEVQ